MLKVQIEGLKDRWAGQVVGLNTVEWGSCLSLQKQVEISLAATNYLLLLSNQSIIYQLLVYKMSENSEKSPAQFPKAQRDVFTPKPKSIQLYIMI